MITDLQYKPFGNQAILIEWPKEINTSILNDLLSFKTKIEAQQTHAIQDLISGYNSLTIIYKEEIISFETEVESLKKLYLKRNISVGNNAVTWQIPVCYDEEFGMDLLSLSEEKSISKADVIKLHSETKYKVYFIGFLPGFLYLGGLNKRLYTNRKANPRLYVPKGSVAIGGEQTGIYPDDSAGGWHIIGNTPISFFDVSKQDPCFAKSGDYIQFEPISKSEYSKLEKCIKNEDFNLKPNLDD